MTALQELMSLLSVAPETQLSPYFKNKCKLMIESGDAEIFLLLKEIENTFECGCEVSSFVQKVIDTKYTIGFITDELVSITLKEEDKKAIFTYKNSKGVKNDVVLAQ